jgi:diguanylate cyclase (GGDEF)-like protein/PAS domain S-box-containing protein
MLLLLVAHALVLPIYALASGLPPLHALAEGMAPGVLAAVAALPQLGRRVRAAVSAAGLMTCSAVVVHIADGATVAHFHFFVMIALLSVYEDWVPFVTSMVYVLAHHAGPAGLGFHEAALHTVYISAAAIANLVAWQLNSDVRDLAHHGEERFRTVVDSVSQVIFETDRAGRFTFLNTAWEEQTGIPAAEALGRPAAEFLHPDDLSEVTRLRRRAQRAQHISVQLRHVTAWGETRWFDVIARPALRGDGSFGTLTDVTERRLSEERLSHQALHDAVTGLPNRTLFLERLERAVGDLGHEGGTVAVLFADVDAFKAINDELGHHAGDELLRRVAQVLREELGPHDTAARFGGDEFAILCDRISDPEAAIATAERVLARFDHDPSLSIGIAIGGPGNGADVLLRDADAAMYRAKAAGRNRFEVYDDSMRTSALERLRLEGELRTALAEEQFVLHYQPVVRLRDERVVGTEALMRWEHPEDGLRPPSEFICVAERSGLIGELGEWALREACRRTADLADGRWVSVNLSPRQLSDRELPSRVEAALADAGLPARQLHLEITEGVLVEDDHRTQEVLHRLEQLGVVLVLDDFGTGYSSLGYLKRFPLDVVKIDRAFADVCEDPSDAAIVTAILGMAHALGMTVVAEGIETAEQADRLTAMGCEMGQGWHFGRPLAPASELTADLAAGASTPK